MKRQFSELPKIEGAGRRGSGIWPGHAAEARDLREHTMGNLDNPEVAERWSCVAEGQRVHAASRIAGSIKKGVAVDFGPDTTGHYDARCRHNPDSPPNGPKALYDVWARYVYTGPEQPKRRARKPRAAATRK